MAKKILITTAIDYVNDVIHIGHAYQKILADSLVRFYRQQGNEVFFLTGTDEHGSKTEETAAQRGIMPQEFADEISLKDRKQLQVLNISFDRFIRTTDPDHYKTVKDFYLKSYENNDVYLGEYKGIYCVGCESFLKEKDLINNHCPVHPRQNPQRVTEENYFFKWSRYQGFLRDWIKNHPDFIQPESRRNEMLSFLEQGLEDLPISRTSVKFGIPVPNDPNHVLYVWFDALINYITGAPEYWQDQDSTIIHILGKDNVRWHALLWPAMLKSIDYRLPNVIYGHDFLTLNGQKISKSLGNIIRPTELVKEFGVDAARYFFLRYGPLRDDVDITLDRIKEVYNADLANGLGNLVARIAKLAQSNDLSFINQNLENRLVSEIAEQLKKFRVDLALERIWQAISTLDQYLEKEKPWTLKGEKQIAVLKTVISGSDRVISLLEIAKALIPLMPQTAQKIQEQFKGPNVRKQPPLFPRR